MFAITAMVATFISTGTSLGVGLIYYRYLQRRIDELKRELEEMKRKQ